MSTSRSNSKTVIQVVSCFVDFKPYLSPLYEISVFDLRYDAAELLDYLGYRGCEDLINKAHEDDDCRFHDDEDAMRELENNEDIFICAEKGDKVVALWLNPEYDDLTEIIASDLFPFIIDNLKGESKNHSTNPQLSEVHHPNQEIHLKPFGFSSFNDYLKK